MSKRISEYAGSGCWQNFCQSLHEEGIKDSDMFDDFSIFSEELEAGDRVLIKWLPDRECVVRYLGNNKFVAETCKNSSIQTGDTFSCLEFRLNQPAVMEQFISIDDASKNPKRYVAGLKHGISHLQKLNT